MDPKGYQREKASIIPFSLSDIMTATKGRKKKPVGPSSSLQPILSSFLLETGLSWPCRACLMNATEKRTSVDSSLFFNYPILNHSLVTLDIFDLPPGPASYKVTQYYPIRANFFFLLEGSTNYLKK